MDQAAGPMPSQKPQEPKPEYGKGYGKRPLWQWILIYVVIGGLVYAAVYYFAFAKRGYSYPAPAPAPTGAMPINNGQTPPPPPSGYPQKY